MDSACPAYRSKTLPANSVSARIRYSAVSVTSDWWATGITGVSRYPTPTGILSAPVTVQTLERDLVLSHKDRLGR